MEIGRLVLGSWSKATALGERDNSDDLCGFAGVDPAAQEGNTLGGPWSVAQADWLVWFGHSGGSFLLLVGPKATRSAPVAEMCSKRFGNGASTTIADPPKAVISSSVCWSDPSYLGSSFMVRAVSATVGRSRPNRCAMALPKPRLPRHQGDLAAAVSNPRQPVRNERRCRRPPHGRRTGTAGEWPPAPRGSPPAPATDRPGRGPPPRGRVRIR